MTFRIFTVLFCQQFELMNELLHTLITPILSRRSQQAFAPLIIALDKDQPILRFQLAANISQVNVSRVARRVCSLQAGARCVRCERTALSYNLAQQQTGDMS